MKGKTVAVKLFEVAGLADWKRAWRFRPMPVISVIASTYNRPDTVAELLEALSRQTFTDFEVLFVNDAG